MSAKIRQIKECPDCGSDNIVYSEIRDQIVCRDCGLIYEPLAITEKKTKKTVKKKGKKKKRKYNGGTK